MIFLCLNSGFKPLPCEEDAIGIETGRIADSKMTSNSSTPGFESFKGRLNHEHAWCSSSALPSYLQVDLRITYTVCAVATQGNSSNSSSFVEEYEVQFSQDGFKWDFYHNITDVKVRLINICTFPGHL